MSLQSARDFLGRLREDPHVWESARSAITLEGEKASISTLKLAGVAAGHGFEMTEEELMQEILALDSGNRGAELSDDQLGTIAGGAGFDPSHVIVSANLFSHFSPV